MPGFTDGLPQPSKDILSVPQDVANDAHEARLARLTALPGYGRSLRKALDRRPEAIDIQMPFVTPEGIQDTLDGTHVGIDNHRLLTPHLQELLNYPDTAKSLMDGIDAKTGKSTEKIIKGFRKRRGFATDVLVIGSGPHGAAAATTIADLYPSLGVVTVDQNEQLGSFWRNNGPRASLRMNSRVRKADYRLPALPRTPGSINPLGRFSPLELSDIVQGNYALDTELGRANAINSYLGSTATLMGSRVRAIYDEGDFADVLIDTPDDDQVFARASVVINAPGIKQQSAINLIGVTHEQEARFFDRNDIYKHMGGDPAYRSQYEPALEKFHEKTVVVVGGGDTALTALEALLGNLPPESYGTYGPGRFRPAKIYWIGAPGTTAQEIDACLRSRYKNGIIQALPKNESDEGAIIEPVPVRARNFSFGTEKVNVFLSDGNEIEGDYLIDATNIDGATTGPVIFRNRFGTEPTTVYNVGAGGDQTLTSEALRVISELGISENTASLWALMDLTTQAAGEAGAVASDRILDLQASSAKKLIRPDTFKL